MKPKQGILTMYKKRGETPLECLERFKDDNPEYKEDKMTYAGRLDPLAGGLLLVLVGEECKNKEKYLGLDKEYEVDILFGFSTDTHDILGKVIACDLDTECPNEKFSEVGPPHAFEVVPRKVSSVNYTQIKNTLGSFVGKFSQKYPAFSSKTIKGKTMFSLFKSGELKDEDIPEKNVEIKSIELLGERTISKKDLEKYIKESVSLVKGDFRQKEILGIWEKELSKIKMSEFNIFSIKVNCTSGTYMRSLANTIGEKVGIPALALNIKRTSVGKYKINK